MASHHLLPLLLLLILLPSSSSTTNPCTAPLRSPPGSTDLSIFHAHSPCTTPSSPPTPPSPLTSVLSSARADPSRLSFLVSPPSRARSTNVPISFNSNAYLLRSKLGTPAQPLLLALDTSYDSSFVSSSSFNTSASSTYSPLPCSSPQCPLFKGPPCPPDSSTPSPCSFNMSYGGNDAASISATLSQDSLILALDVLPSYTFASANSVGPKQGLLGLGRGPNGLLSQSGSLYSGVFSYCLPSYKSYYFSGSLRLGPTGQPKTIRTTPLLSNPHRPSLYYVNLTGVSVGRVLIPVPAGSFDFNPQNGAGTVVDSGTVITRFVAGAYAAIRDEFRKQVNVTDYSSLGAFDTCFATDKGDGVMTPAVTLHLTGMDLALPAENTLIHSSAMPLACLAMAAAPDNVNSVVNVIANYQQQNHRVMIDVANSRVGFARELCS